MKITPIQRTVFSQRKREQTWKVSDSANSQENNNCPRNDLEKRNENKYLRKHLTLPQSSVIFIK